MELGRNFERGAFGMRICAHRGEAVSFACRGPAVTVLVKFGREPSANRGVVAA